MNLVPVQALDWPGLATCPVPTSTLVRALVFLSLGVYLHWIVKLEKVENQKFTNPCPDREAADDAGQARLVAALETRELKARAGDQVTSLEKK